MSETGRVDVRRLYAEHGIDDPDVWRLLDALEAAQDLPPAEAYDTVESALERFDDPEVGQ